jgi:hypothetical protein
MRIVDNDIDTLCLCLFDYSWCEILVLSSTVISMVWMIEACKVILVST